MTTKAYDNVKTLCRGVEDIFVSAVFAGIVADARHKRRKQGTYHLSREDNPPDTYSVVRPDDKAGQGPDDAAAAFDISMNRVDMMLATRRLAKVWANISDPRRKFLNAFNGWLGGGDAQRYDIVGRRIKRATSDHKSHLHVEIRRVYVLSAAMVKAVLSALRDESVMEYLTSIGVVPRTVARVAVPRYPGHVLRRTDEGKADLSVQLWQLRMLARGWKSIGKPDGHFGPRTESVVRRYQRVCKVPDDGVIGLQTWPLPWTRPLG